MNYQYNGQVLQDKFVVSVLNGKMNGFFLEIGSNDPIFFNNTYILEKHLNWTGIMVECDNKYLPYYKIKRPNSIHIIDDATKINYLDIFIKNNFPKNIDYLQIDLEVSNKSTLNTLENLSRNCFQEYKFATVTFEHDIYTGDHFNTRATSREIFNNFGYVLVFQDVRNVTTKFEDWYVHPDLVNMNYIDKIKRNTSLDFNEIMNIIDSQSK